MRLLGAAFYILLTALIIVESGYCQNAYAGRAVNTVEGDITQIDTVGGTFVVRWMGWGDGIEYHWTTFSVLPSTKITKDADTISFLNVNQFDRVVVRYVYANSPVPIAINISVNNSLREVI